VLSMQVATEGTLALLEVQVCQEVEAAHQQHVQDILSAESSAEVAALEDLQQKEQLAAARLRDAERNLRRSHVQAAKILPGAAHALVFQDAPSSTGSNGTKYTADSHKTLDSQSNMTEVTESPRSEASSAGDAHAHRPAKPKREKRSNLSPSHRPQMARIKQELGLMRQSMAQERARFDNRRELVQLEIADAESERQRWSESIAAARANVQGSPAHQGQGAPLFQARSESQSRSNNTFELFASPAVASSPSPVNDSSTDTALHGASGSSNGREIHKVDATGSQSAAPEIPTTAPVASPSDGDSPVLPSQNEQASPGRLHFSSSLHERLAALPSDTVQSDGRASPRRSPNAAGAGAGANAGAMLVLVVLLHAYQSSASL